ncbi:MAG: DUF6089 family protein [Bacteroidota bacterium]
MKTTLKLLLLFLLTLPMQSIKAQRSEVGFFGGTSYYIGDLNPYKQFLMIRPAGGIVYRYNFNPRFSFKGNFFYGNVAGDDLISDFNAKRNLSFKSVVADFSAEGEFNFLPYITGNPKYPFTPYIFGGISMFKFNPKANYEGTWYALQPLGTEGQGTSMYPDRQPYSLTSFAIPFGLGFRFNLFGKISLGFEYGMRRTFTDYLDDVSSTYADPYTVGSENGPTALVLSDRTIRDLGETPNNTDLQRGNSKNKDWYSFAGIILSFRIKAGKENCPAYGKSRKFHEYDSR